VIASRMSRPLASLAVSLAGFVCLGALSLAAQAPAPRQAQEPAKSPAAAKPAAKDAAQAPDAASAPAKAAAKTTAPATAHRTSASAAADTPKLAFEKFTLPNGLQVILHVDRKLPIVHVNEWFHVGSKNERPGRTGFAHLFEHMMFQGSTNASGEYFAYAEKAGANLREGGVNGTTNQDRTNYFATVPSANLETLLWLESDRVATLADATTKEKLDNQRDVVKNERRESLENVPYGRWFTLLGENLFPGGHPYSWPVIGSMEDLTAASLDDVKDFFRRYYTPNNLSIVIAGDFDPADAKRLVEKYFGGIPPGPALDRPARSVATLTSERIVEVHDRVPTERVYMAWPAPEYFAEGEAGLEIAARILGDGLSSRLNKALVYDHQLCTNVSAFEITGEIAGAFVIIADARPGTPLPKIEGLITEELAKLAKTGPTLAELDRAKTKQEFTFISGLEGIGGFGGKADVLNQYNTFLGDPGKVDADLARYRTLTPADVRTTVDRWINTRNRLLIRFHPETSGRPSTTTLDRSKQPSFGEDRAFHAPEVQTTKLENGVEVFVVERKDLPKVSVTLAMRAGAIADPAEKPGVAAMTMRTIDLGTPTRKALDIENALGDLGTSLSGNTGREYASINFEVLSRNVAPAFAILADVAQHASFPATEFAREKTQQLDSLAQTAKNPNAIATRVRSMLAFGPDHPYGRPVQGLPRTIESISREDLVAFHRDHWKPGGAAVVFVGNITLDEATKLARQQLGGWTGGAPAEIAMPEPKPAPAGRIYLIDRQDSAQTVVTQFLPGPKRQTEDYDSLALADAVWGGGGFGTRLNLNLREDKGYSYGVFSNLSFYQTAGLWYASGGVQTNKTKESVVEFDKELKALAGAKPISADEFATAKIRRVRGYPQAFESYGRVAGQIVDLWTQHIPMTEFQRAYDATTKASLDEALAAAKKYVHPDRTMLLLVGDRTKIEAGLKDLNLGPVVVLDAEGKPAEGGAGKGTATVR
jgi:zinc protease